MLWSRFEPTGDGYRLQVYAEGASPPDWVGKATPYAIGGIAALWLTERVMGW